MSPVPDAPPPYGTIAFDCDSTLATVEGIDELAAMRPDALPEIEALTSRAMAGELPLEAVYGARLDRIRPTRAELDAVGDVYVRAALPGGRELVAGLHALGKRVAVVSGGLLPAVRVLADHLGIEAALVHAVDVRFDEAGAYAGFEEDSPIARAGGKIDLVRSLAAAPEGGAVALVGDGATDIEAAGACARVVAFGGVARRPAVFEQAAVSCEAADLRALLPLLTTDDERARLAADPAHASLLESPHGT